MRSLVISLVLVLSACATTVSTPRQGVAAVNAAIDDFVSRTDRLCFGASPVLSKPDCAKRIEAQEKAIKASRMATGILAACTTPADCAKADGAMALAQEALKAIEPSIYGSQK